MHEAGAIEARGHKVIPVRGHDGKLYAEDVQTWIDNFFADQNHEHMVYPGMISISHPTEYGTLYTREELFALRDVACAHNIPLYLDGARLGYALGCPSNELALPDIAFLTDVFSIGGTKVGALFGEAVVFSQENVPPHFPTCLKRQGALLAKGWLLGLQFDTLFTDNLYEDLGRNANVQAKKIRDALGEKGYHIFLDSPTNQIFLLFENHELDEFMKKINVSFWERIDSNHILIRLATSWATTDSQVQELLDIL